MDTYRILKSRATPLSDGLGQTTFSNFSQNHETRRQRSGTPLHILAQQTGKTLLGEMSIIGQHFGELHLQHAIHGDSVCQAVPLIESHAVTSEPGIKSLTGLRFDVNPC